MAIQYSIQKMVSDGTLSTIALGIQYLQRNDIYIRIAGEDTPQSGAHSGYTWSFLDNTTLKILPVVPNGVEVVVYRRTGVDAMYNVYSQNAQFDEATIDENNQQLLYIAQEYLEQGLPGTGVDTIEYVRDDGSFTYYRMRRTDGSYSEEFAVPSASNSTKVLTREALRRSYAEAGYNLVDGSFEAGGTLTNVNDVLLQESTGKAFSGPAGTVAAGTDPTSGGFTDRSARILRKNLDIVSVFSFMTDSQVQDVTSKTGSIDVTDAMNAARATGRNVRYPGGRYKVLGVCAGSTALMIDADPDAVFDFTGNINEYPIEVSGSNVRIADLSGTHNAGGRTVTFASAHGLSVGDVFVIWNPTPGSWSNFRPEYNAGEWCRVVSVSGLSVTVSVPLYDTYTASAVQVHKVASPKMKVTGFNAQGDTSAGIIKASLCLYPEISDSIINHKNNSAIYWDRCYAQEEINCNIHNMGSGSGSGDDYGTSIGNSQHARIIGGNHYSRRHAVTHGGSSGHLNVPCRDCRTVGAVISNDPASGVIAADFHGNTEDSSFDNCNITGGATWQGKGNGYNNCVITDDVGGRIIYSAEILGGRFYARNCEFRGNVDPSTSVRGVIDVGGSSDSITADTKLDTTFELRNCKFNGKNYSSITSLFVMKNRGCTKKINFEIDGIDVDVNSLGQILFTKLFSGTADSGRIIIDNISNAPSGTLLHNAGGGAYLLFPHKLQRQTGKVTLTATSGTSSTIASPISFKYPYPTTPSVYVGGLTRAAGNLPTNIGVYTVTASTVRPMIYSGSATTWTSTLDVSVNWASEINEI